MILGKRDSHVTKNDVTAIHHTVHKSKNKQILTGFNLNSSVFCDNDPLEKKNKT